MAKWEAKWKNKTYKQHKSIKLTQQRGTKLPTKPVPSTTKLGKYVSLRMFLTSMATPIKVLQIDDVTNSSEFSQP